MTPFPSDIYYSFTNKNLNEFNPHQGVYLTVTGEISMKIFLI